MNDRQLKYILTIAEEGNITSAAQKLFISQPSLSYLLAHVEEELGVKLFDRTVSPMTLTYAGEHYVEAAKKIQSIQNELQSHIDDILDYRKSRLIIGCGQLFSSIIFPAILPTFIKKNPGVQIKLYEQNLSLLEELLVSGHLDLIFTTSVIDNKALECTPLYHEELVLLAPVDFVPASVVKREGRPYPVIDLACVKEHPFVLFKHKHHLRKLTDRVFSDMGFRPNIFLETENWETCFFMASEGLALTLLPYSPLNKKFLTESLDNVSQFNIEGNYSRQLSVYYRKNTYDLKIIKAFIDSTQMILKDYQ